MATRPFWENVFFAGSYSDLEIVAQGLSQLYCVTGTDRPPEEVSEYSNN